MTTGRIWLIGGTHESAQLAIALVSDRPEGIAKADLACIVSVTTEAAKVLYPVTPNLQVVVGKFCFDQLGQFLQTQKITVILDASHPYAVEISRLAIAAATQLQIPYLRFERPALEAAPDDDSPIIKLDSFATLLAGSYLQGQRVLLTVGYKPLSLFTPWQTQAMLFARILPSTVALEAAIAAGFQPECLLAVRPPVPAEMERALWQHWQISLVVTKASGKPGGEEIKRAVATELGVTLVVITRPNMLYPQQTSNLSAALEFCYQHANDSRI